MSERETIKECEKDGWTIKVQLVPDYDYQPGQDDDIYPNAQEVRMDPNTGEYPSDGWIVDFRHGQMHVSGEEIERLLEIGGGGKKQREAMESDIRAIGHEYLSWVGVIVTATRGDISGEDSLYGVEYDLRQSEPAAYALETVETYDMIENAIQDAARSSVGNLATQALSY